VGLVQSIYPLVEILDWHEGPAASSAELQMLDSPRPVLVYRREFRVRQRYIRPVDYLFMKGLRSGRPVGSLLDELAGQGFGFQAWIEEAIKQNLINNLYLI